MAVDVRPGQHRGPLGGGLSVLLSRRGLRPACTGGRAAHCGSASYRKASDRRVEPQNSSRVATGWERVDQQPGGQMDVHWRIEAPPTERLARRRDAVVTAL